MKIMIKAMVMLILSGTLTGCGTLGMVEESKVLDEESKAVIYDEATIEQVAENSVEMDDEDSLQVDEAIKREDASLKDIIFNEEIVPSFEYDFADYYRFIDSISDEFGEEMVFYSSDIIVGDIIDADTLAMKVVFSDFETGEKLAEHSYHMVYQPDLSLFEVELVEYVQSHYMFDSIELMEIEVTDEVSLHCKYGIRRGISITTGYNYYMDFYRD